MGAFVFNDAPLRTLMASILSLEDLKSLFDVREEASIPARYATAIFPSRCPRLFIANSGSNADAGHYFSTYGYEDLVKFARRESLDGFNADTLAVLRRMIIFKPTRAQIGFRPQHLQSRSGIDYDAEVARRQAFLDRLDAA